MNSTNLTEAITPLLCRPIRVFTYSTIDSTNNQAKRLIANGLNEPALLIADTQTAGKGRLGRSFYSPSETGLYMSLVLHPNAAASKWISITSAAAVAVCFAIEKLSGLSPKIKWVNDIYIGERKICGILTEAVSDPHSRLMTSVVIGIGVNLTTSAFPDEIANRASSLYTDAPSPFTRAELAAAITNELLALANHLADGKWLSPYRARAYLDGKEIVYFENGISHQAIAVGVDEQGGLIIEENAVRKVLTSGEVTVRTV